LWIEQYVNMATKSNVNTTQPIDLVSKASTKRRFGGIFRKKKKPKPSSVGVSVGGATVGVASAAGDSSSKTSPSLALADHNRREAAPAPTMLGLVAKEEKTAPLEKKQLLPPQVPKSALKQTSKPPTKEVIDIPMKTSWLCRTSFFKHLSSWAFDGTYGSFFVTRMDFVDFTLL
jgi:hypothetical protein